MPFLAPILALLLLGALLFDQPALVLGPALALMAAATTAGVFIGMGRARPALALAAAAGIAGLLGWTAPAAVLLGAATGAAWGPFRRHGPLLGTVMLAVGSGGFLAALMPNALFDPTTSAGMATLALAALPLVRLSIPVAAITGAMIGMSWGMAGFGGAALLAGAVLALHAALGRRYPARALMVAAGMGLGVLAGMAVAWFQGVGPAALGPTVPALFALLVLGLLPLLTTRAGGPYAAGVLLAMAAASVLAPTQGALWMAIVAMIGAAQASGIRPSLFGAMERTPHRVDPWTPSFPWIGRVWSYFSSKTPHRSTAPVPSTTIIHRVP